MNEEFTFHAALSVCASSMEKTFSTLEEENCSLAPLHHVMFTPIAETKKAHRTIQEIAGSYDVDVIFDSGGYEVQVGNKDFDDLYAYLVDYYNENRWGERYVLPDNVPITGDDKDTVWRKVKETISASRLCYNRLPEESRPRAIAVAQGHTREQISRCLEVYSSDKFPSLTTVGFGSFGTSGANYGVNMITPEAFENLQWAVDLAHDAGLEVHAFGVGGPTSIPLLYEAGVDSFDTTSWMRSSGYGNVFFPFKSRFNATHRKNRGGKTLTAAKLPELKLETGHQCPFCEDITRLRENRWDRIAHNLIVIHEMTENILDMDNEEVITSMDSSSKYRKQLETVVAD